MKVVAISFTIFFTIMSISSALAGGRHGHHYNKHHHRDRHYYSGHDHYTYRPRRHTSHYDSDGSNVAYALGGLVIGGILGSTLTNSYNNRAGRTYYSEPVYSAPRQVNNRVLPTYMMQSDGICYLVSHVNNGNLVLSPAASGNCR